MNRHFVTTSIGAAGLCALFLVPMQGCTNLEEHPTSQVSPGNFFHTESEVLATLAGVYAQLRGTLDDYYNLSEISSDEMIVPTRGQDWYDNGAWLEMHRQTWTASSVDGLGAIQGAWNNALGGIARANVLLDAMPGVNVPNKAAITAEARVLRAFYYYTLLDMFGGAPLATTGEIKPRPRSTRKELFDFIESELLAARADLPDSWPAGMNGRITKGAANAILASLYINAGVFTKDAGVSATAYNSCSGITVTGGDACAQAIAAADAIINSGVYQLADTFVKNFRSDNATSPENIFVIKFADADNLGLNFVMRALHYNQFTPTPWNGFSALATVYNAFDAGDARRNIFLIGPQVNLETGAPAKDRAGNPLIFTDTIKDITQATEAEGPRIYKWPIDPGHVAQNNGNDYAWFRLAEIMLIKAEALNEQNPGDAGALALLNAVRARDFNPANPVATINHATILQERQFELTGEGKRRTDLIRFGLYTAPNMYKAATTDAHFILMPIPQSQIDANPLLVQNPGY
jgi:hypothetical protein